MRVITVTAISVLVFLILGSGCEGFPKKKLLIGLGVKAHLGNVLLQNAARAVQFKQQLAENILGTAVKHSRAKADILSVLLSATQALHNPPQAQYGEHNDNGASQTSEEVPPGLPEIIYPPPEHTAEATDAPTESPPPLSYPPTQSTQGASFSTGIYPPPSPIPVYGTPSSSYGFPNDVQEPASDRVFRSVNVQKLTNSRGHGVQIQAPYVRLGVNSDGVNLQVGK